MIDLNKINLIKKEENADFFSLQEHFLNEYREKEDMKYLVQVALLMSLFPIADELEAIKLLELCYEESADEQVFIIGSFLHSTCKNWEDNFFLQKRFEKYDMTQSLYGRNALEAYLYAYDIYMRNEDGRKEKCKKILEKYLCLQPDYPSYYFLLAKVDNENYSQWMAVGKKYIKFLMTEEDLKKINIDKYLIDPQYYIESEILELIVCE